MNAFAFLTGVLGAIVAFRRSTELLPKICGLSFCEPRKPLPLEALIAEANALAIAQGADPLPGRLMKMPTCQFEIYRVFARRPAARDARLAHRLARVGARSTRCGLRIHFSFLSLIFRTTALDGSKVRLPVSIAPFTVSRLSSALCSSV
jgi:hypothetical protein